MENIDLKSITVGIITKNNENKSNNKIKQNNAIEKKKVGIIKLHKYTVLVVIIYLLVGLNICINSIRMKVKKGYQVSEFSVKISRNNKENNHM